MIKIFCGNGEVFMDNLLGEFFGTMILITFGCGNVANMNLNKSKAQGGGWVGLAFG